MHSRIGLTTRMEWYDRQTYRGHVNFPGLTAAPLQSNFHARTDDADADGDAGRIVNLAAEKFVRPPSLSQAVLELEGLRLRELVIKMRIFSPYCMSRSISLSAPTHILRLHVLAICICETPLHSKYK